MCWGFNNIVQHLYPKYRRPTGECLVILHTRNTTSVTLDGHEQSGYEQSVIPQERFKHSKDHHETPGGKSLIKSF